MLFCSPNGYCLLPIGDHLHTVIGGTFDAFKGCFGVCLEKHSSRAKEADILLDVPDFGVPSAREFSDTITRIVRQMIDEPDVPIYVGCRGGIGRTGMVIAALVRATIPDVDPVGWTRRNYLQSAVETGPQRALVESFDVQPALRLLNLHERRGIFSRLISLFSLP